ncbi:hypothetical protein QYF61_016875 [Mycteria americana]|uniref:Integrase catalytic domain-containing protein n=1 Tax=Mycteria americana TaxID=33587 RepID=A0AAN7NGN2_MYCAM|nr:hypothetical protein QYF61_016875 [Mycteria americana]
MCSPWWKQPLDGWKTYPVSHATARNTILGLEKQVLWRHGTPERTESDNRTHFQNNLIDTWAKEHGIEWVYHTPYHAPASGKIKRIRDMDLLEQVQKRTTKMIREHLPCEDKMRELTLFNLEKPIRPSRTTTYWKDGEGLFIRERSDRIRGHHVNDLTPQDKSTNIATQISTKCTFALCQHYPAYLVSFTHFDGGKGLFLHGNVSSHSRPESEVDL